MHHHVHASVNVLLADDDEDDRQLVTAIFRQLLPAVPVWAVNDGEAAISHLRAYADKITLLITDLNMPRLDGCELLARMRASAEHRSLPTVVLTTSSANDDRQRCYQAGANAYLVKPLSYSELTALIRMVARIWLPEPTWYCASRES